MKNLAGVCSNDLSLFGGGVETSVKVAEKMKICESKVEEKETRENIDRMAIMASTYCL